MTKKNESKSGAPMFDGYEAERANSTKIDVPEGDGKFVGLFQGTATMMVNPSAEDLRTGKAQPGEKKEMPIVRFLDPKTKEPLHINGDAGLMTTIQSSGLESGQLVGLHRKEKVKLEGGKSVNDWDVYKLNSRA